LTELWSVALFFGPPCRSVQSEKLSRAADRLPFWAHVSLYLVIYPDFYARIYILYKPTIWVLQRDRAAHRVLLEDFTQTTILAYTTVNRPNTLASSTRKIHTQDVPNYKSGFRDFLTIIGLHSVWAIFFEQLTRVLRAEGLVTMPGTQTWVVPTSAELLPAHRVLTESLPLPAAAAAAAHAATVTTLISTSTLGYSHALSRQFSSVVMLTRPLSTS